MASNSGNIGLEQNTQQIMDIIKNQQDITKMMLAKELLDIKDVKVTINGEEHIIPNIELTTEYSSANATKYMVKMETWRYNIREVLHLKTLEEEKIVGAHNYQVMLKMISHRRKRVTEFVNSIRNEPAGAEVIPTKTKTKKFLGIV